MTADGSAQVDEYLAALPAADRATLQELRSILLGMMPEATERISYGIPIVKQGRDVVGFGAQRHHLALYTMSPPLIEALKDQLTSHTLSGKSTIRFTADDPLPRSLIETIVAERLAENSQR